MTRATPRAVFAALLASLLAAVVLTVPDAARASGGTDWVLRTGPSTNKWKSVTYGGPADNKLFVAVASTGTGDRVMTSPDGVTWTPRTSAADKSWASITYAAGLFVAVGSGGGNTDRVMTSPDGITWTSRTTPNVDYSWSSVAYGNGKFVAVSSSSQADNVMTSPDGIIWTRQTGTPAYGWRAVTYGNGRFVAVRSSRDPTAQVMTSPDGVTWTTRNAVTRWWAGVYYGGPTGSEQFIAVSTAGEAQGVMTSPNGIDWTVRDTPQPAGEWTSVVYGDGQYVAVADGGTGCTEVLPNCAMTSTDGVTWTAHATPAFRRWYSVTYADGVFVSVADTAVTNNVMTSGSFNPEPSPSPSTSPTDSPTPTPTPTPTATPAPTATPTPTPSPTARQSTALRVVALSARHRMKTDRTAVLTRSSRTNGTVTSVRTACLLRGRELHGATARRVCGLAVDDAQATRVTERTRTRVTATPGCSRGVSVNVRISARAPGHTRSVWDRTWRTAGRPAVSCTLRGTG